ncbi:MAG: radical SAM protein [Candidatus Aminicenantes bacterium]|nr:radical SAM protein [Candidatus Aminicenantes bacterium]
MINCRRCQQEKAAQAIGLGPSCLKEVVTEEIISQAHFSRQKYGLPSSPPRNKPGLLCSYCANECQLGEGQVGFCGLRINRSGRINSLAPEKYFAASFYYDPLPTNCCAAWFCPGSKERGVNLAVFFYGCNFDCLFCQNATHRLIRITSFLSLEELVKAALVPQVRCVCFFGGSPEPQLPLAIEASQEITRQAKRKIRICWEWNGGGHPTLVQKAAEISLETGGTVKFDLKAWSPAIGRVLCGVSLDRSFENLSRLGRLFPQADFLTATTLLVPFYIDEGEVESIARFLASINPDFPYSLLIFHPDDRLRDLPITPKQQVQACYEAARRYLRRVNVGNLHLLERIL